MKVALAHDYLIQMGGAERVVEVLHSMFPNAPIYTTALDSSRLLYNLKNADIRTSWLQKIPGSVSNFKRMLPLYPIAVKDFDFRDFDIVISSSSAFMKGIKVPDHTFHVCYCHTPMRFAWDYDNYMMRESNPAVMKRMLGLYMMYLKNWDVKTSSRVDQFIANSSIVKHRIAKFYQRDAEVIFPPINTSRFNISPKVDNYYLVVSRLVSYKRIDLAVQSFNELGIPLYIVGDGPDKQRLQSMAKPNVTFLGRLEDEEINKLMANCRALIFPGEEDFGITPLEVNAAGRPVIAYQAGGALDTVVPEINGVFFQNQTVESVVQAVNVLEKQHWDGSIIRQHAMKFDVDQFKNKLNQFLQVALQRFQTGSLSHSSLDEAAASKQLS
ncbi:glycosyltransferase [Longirhabdus pacifica]|uniref:glycosyltransferase n=1 Tax=Longirhabdus pacifica TaxID=2305227 RepID=UPI001009205B|nr:glycosyltransferase [Longirhabdus pacifica]